MYSLRHRLPLLIFAVLATDATNNQAKRLIAAGAVAYLTKPLDLSALLRLLDEQLPAHQAVNISQ